MSLAPGSYDLVEGTYTFTVSCGPPPANQYTLTLNKTGSGDGVMTGAGTYPANQVVTPTATPNAQSTFEGWDGPVPVQMTSNQTRVGTFALISAPAGGPGIWTPLVTGSAYTSPTNWYYAVGAVERTGAGRIWFHWSAHTYLCDLAQGQWIEQTTQNSLDWRENFGADHEPATGLFHLSPGAPVSSGSNPQVWTGSVTYDPVAKIYASAPAGGVAHCVYGLDPLGNRLMAFGGWSVNGPLRARVLTGSTWTQLTSSVPPLTQDGARETCRRGGVDSRDGSAWVIADGNELYRWTAATNVWTQVPTTGTKPTNQYGVYALHEGANTIVGHVGRGSIGDDGAAPMIDTTYLLDLATKVWRLGPATKPPGQVMVRQQLLYDRVRGRVLWIGVDPATNGTSVWGWSAT